VIEIVNFKDANGRSPIEEWLSSLRDKIAKARITSRLRQLQSGNMGDARPVGEGVVELRVHVGAGYRVYLGRYGERWIVLLCGGDKGTQTKDIARAKAYWAEWKQRQI
jgi:putative addiction module killer protein